MRKMVCVLILLIWMITLASLATAEVNQDPQKFKVIYTVTYNSVTLKEASKIETQIKRNHKVACVVKVKVEESAGNITGNLAISDDTNIIMWTTD